MSTELDTLDIYLGTTGDCYCSAISIGVIDDKTVSEKLIPANVRRTINAGDTNAECKVAVPNTVCPPNLTLKDEYEFVIGQPTTSSEILYGYYFFETGNRGAPLLAVQDVSNDIATYPPGAPDAHYTLDQWDPAGIFCQIPSPYVCYHVIRLSNTLSTIQIIDEGGVKVNNGWSTLSDANYTYYVLQIPIAPSDVTYEVKQ